MPTLNFTAKRLCAVFAAAVLVGCGGGGGGTSPSPTGEAGTTVSGEVVSGVKVVDSAELAPVTVSAGGGSLTVSGAAGGALGTITDGQVVMLPADESKGLPLGFTGKAEKQADGSVKLVQAQMGDVFKRLQVDFDSQRDGGVVAGVMTHGSAKADFSTGYPRTLQGGVEWLDYVSCKLTAALKVEGEIKCSNGALNGTVSINHPVKVKKKGSGEEATAYLYAEVSVYDLVQKAFIDFDKDKYPKTGGVGELTAKVSGRWNYKMGIKIDEGGLTGSEATLFEIPSWSELIRKDGNNIWDENTKLKFSKYFELSGLNGDDKKGLIPLAGIYFTPTNISTGGMPFTGDLSAAQLGQIKALGVVVWVYVDISGNIILRGDANLLEVKGPQVEKGFSIKRNGDELQSETINTGGEAEVLAPSINGSVEMTQNLGVPMVLDVLVSGIRPASVRVDLLAFQNSGKMAGNGGYRWNPQPRGLWGEVCLSNDKKLYSQLDFRAAINAKLDVGWLELEGGKEFQKAFDHVWWAQYDGVCANNYELTLVNESMVPDTTTAGYAVVNLSFLDGFNDPALNRITGEWHIQEEGLRGSKTWVADAAHPGNFSLSLPTGHYTFTVTALHKEFKGRDGNPLVVKRSEPLEVEVTPAQVVASASSANVAQAVEFWIKNAWSTIKTVVWDFAGTVVEQTVTLVNGVGTKVSYVFSSEGTKAVTATYKDAAGNTVGTGLLSVLVNYGSIEQTATITQVLDDSGANPVAIVSGGVTEDTTPVIRGTLSAPLPSSTFYSVRLYSNGAEDPLGSATVSGTGWSFTPAAPLPSGEHRLTARVVRFDGGQSTASAEHTVRVQVISVGTAAPAEATRATAATLHIAGTDLPTSALSVLVPGHARNTCLAPENLQNNGFDITCTFYQLGAQPLDVWYGSRKLGTVTVTVKSNVSGVTWATGGGAFGTGTVQFGQMVTYKVSGTQLLADNNLGFAVDRCGVSNTEVGTPSNTARTFQCWFNNEAGATAGSMSGVVADGPGGQRLHSFVVPVEVAPIDTNASVTVSWDYGSVGSAVTNRGTNPRTVAINDGVEIEGFLNNPMVDVDISASKVRLYNLRSYTGAPGTAALSSATFNGVVLRLPSAANWVFGSASVGSGNTLVGLNGARLSVTSGANSQLAINLQGLGYDASTVVEVAYTRTSPSTPSTSKLPHTGVTASQCYQAGSDTLVACDSAGAIALSGTGKQDGMLASTNAMSYSNVGSYSKEECVKDNVTGLVWEGKTASGLRAGSNTYTNYHSSYYGTQAQMDAATNTYGYVAYVNSTALCGYTDWRLPIVEELQTLVHYGIPYPYPAINATWFPSSRTKYWSSSPNVLTPGSAWGVSFVGPYVGYGGGGVSEFNRYEIFGVRLVRADR